MRACTRGGRWRTPTCPRTPGSARPDGAVRALAGVLPPDVRLRGLAPAPDGFDARFSALWRRYSYRVSDEPATADPLRRNETLWYPRRLSVDRMNAAAAALLGEHDFAAFCRRREGATTVRRLLRLDWARDDDGVAVATVVADAFCHNMVRALIGALLAVGEGRRALDWPRQVLAAAVRDHAVHVVPPHGLCLAEVRYPPPGELAARPARPAGCGPCLRPDAVRGAGVPGVPVRYPGVPMTCGWPLTMRLLRAMLALPEMRPDANCSS